MATLAPGFSFGQREYLSVLFAMPYLASACVRLQRFQNADRLVYAAVGLLAGIGFAIKPFFLAVPLLVEGLLVAWLGRRSLFRLESVVLALTVLAYVLAVLVLCASVRDIHVTSHAVDSLGFRSGSFSMVLSRYWAVTQPLLYGALVALLSRTWTRQHTVVLLAGLGYSVSYFIQAKGFVYHAYPVLLFCCAFLGISVASGLVRVWSSRRDQAGPIPLLLVFAILVLVIPPAKHVHDGVMQWYFQYNLGPRRDWPVPSGDHLGRQPFFAKPAVLFFASALIRSRAFRRLLTRPPSGRAGRAPRYPGGVRAHGRSVGPRA